MRGMKTLVLAIIGLTLLAACASQPDESPTPSTEAIPTDSTTRPDEQQAIAALAKINEAQASYFMRNRRYALAYDELITAFFLKAEPTASESGYEITLRPSADASHYTVIAKPVSGVPTTRHFFTDETGVIRAEAGKDATSGSPAV
jgi:hypothetical protein